MTRGKGWTICIVAVVALAGLGTWARLAAQAGGAAAGAAAAPNDWPTYRVPNANGSSSETVCSSNWATAPNP